MEHRPLGKLPTAVSVVGVQLAAFASGASAMSPLPPTFAGLLRRAAARGVTLFDITADGGERRLAQGIAPALRELSGLHLVMVELPDRVSGRRESAPSDWLASLVRALGERPVDLVLLPPASPSWDPGRFAEAEIAADRLRGWGISVPTSSFDDPRRIMDMGAPVLAVPYSLLDPGRALPLMRAAAEHGVSVLAKDAHARGRLDGSVLRGSPLEEPLHPQRVSELRDRFGPVLALGFLTEGRQRTLAQAAIQFALDAPAVASVLVAPAGPEAIDEMTAAPEQPALTRAERDRILGATVSGTHS